MTSLFFYPVAALGGGLGGVVFALIWRRLVPMSLHATFWSAMVSLAQGILTTEETTEFLRLYRRLAGSLFGYLGRNLAGLVLGCSPVIVLSLACETMLFTPWDRGADTIAVSPAGAATLMPQPAAGQFLLTVDGVAEPIAIDGDPPRTALTSAPLQSLLLESLGFAVVPLDGAADLGFDTVIVRADRDHWNPAFPYANDLEFVFVCMTFVGVAVTFANASGAERGHARKG